MDRWKIPLVVILVFMQFVSGAISLTDSSYFGKSPQILVTMIKQNPDPIEPGNQVEVSFKIDNNGTIVDNFIFEILPSYPLTLLEGESASRNLGSLGVSQRTERSVILKFKLKAAQDAIDGDHEIKARYRTDSTQSWTTLDSFRINVQTHEAILAVEKFSGNPAVTSPGGRVKLRIDLKNYAASLLKNVRISLDFSDVGSEKNPFSPIGSSNEKVISYIAPESGVTVEFELIVDANAVSKAYKLPLRVKYIDNLNKNYSLVNTVTVIVGDKPDLGVALERTEVYSSENIGNVVLRIVNMGTTDIKFLNAKVIQNENVLAVGADEVYVGKLDSDDFSTAEFKLFLKGENSVKIPIQLEYRDTNNNFYKENKEVELKLYSREEAKKLGLVSDSKMVWIISGVFILLLGYYVFRKIRKRKS